MQAAVVESSGLPVFDDEPVEPAHEPLQVKAAPSQSMATPNTTTCVNALVLRGEFWEAHFDGHSVLLEDSRGLRYIALLLQHAAAAEGPLHATELVALACGNSTVVELSEKEEILDGASENRFVKRLEEIGFERNTALAKSDYERVAQLDDEVDQITAELERLRLPGGRGRRASFSDNGEKARKAVSKAISEAIGKLSGLAGSEAMARHLSSTLRKGQWLSYNGGLAWHVEFQTGHNRKHSRFRKEDRRRQAA